MTLLRAASVLAIVALALMVWSLLEPTPAPVLVALTAGQALGTASFVTFLIIIVWDLRRVRAGASLLDQTFSVVPPEPPPEVKDEAAEEARHETKDEAATDARHEEDESPGEDQ